MRLTPVRPAAAPVLFQISRRRFLRRCLAAAAATGLPCWFVERQLLAAETPQRRRPGPNDRPGLALIGCGGMGRGDAANAANHGDLLAVCDVDDTHAAAAAEQFTADGRAPARYHDFRRLLERDDLHAVINATPDHWHTLINLAAIRAGKDIYAEKPLTLTIAEGRQVVAAVRQHGTVLQTGTQQRSSERFRLACELVRHGRLGRLQSVQVWLPSGLDGGPFPTAPVPAGLDWDFWLGQVPLVPYVPERCHGKFRYWYATSGGTVTDWGAHHLDIVNWAVAPQLPRTVAARPLAPVVPGGYDAFADYEIHYTYASGLRLDVRSTRDDDPGGEKRHPEGQRNGIRFEGTDGWIWVNRNQLEASDRELLRAPLPETAGRLPVSRDHMGNFIDCLRTRRAPIADVEAGHRSATLCHLGNIALRTGKTLTWDAARERFVGSGARAGNRHLARPMRAPYDDRFIA